MFLIFQFYKWENKVQELNLPYFSDYKAHRTIRRTYVLEENGGGGGEPAPPLPTLLPQQAR